MKNRGSIALHALSELTRLALQAMNERANCVIWLEISAKDGNPTPFRVAWEKVGVGRNLTNQDKKSHNEEESRKRIDRALEVLRNNLAAMSTKEFTGTVRLTVKFQDGLPSDPSTTTTLFHR